MIVHLKLWQCKLQGGIMCKYQMRRPANIWTFRRLYHRWHHLPMGSWRPSPAVKQSRSATVCQPCSIFSEEIDTRFNIEHYSSSYCNVKTNTGDKDLKQEKLRSRFFLRRIQLLVRWPCVQAPVLLLPHHHLRPRMYARHCILGQLKEMFKL